MKEKEVSEIAAAVQQWLIELCEKINRQREGDAILRRVLLDDDKKLNSKQNQHEH